MRKCIRVTECITCYTSTLSLIYRVFEFHKWTRNLNFLTVEDRIFLVVLSHTNQWFLILSPPVGPPTVVKFPIHFILSRTSLPNPWFSVTRSSVSSSLTVFQLSIVVMVYGVPLVHSITNTTGKTLLSEHTV